MLTLRAELNNWLINAFNGEWLKITNPTPNDKLRKRSPEGEGKLTVYKEVM